MAIPQFIITLGAQWGGKVRHGDVPNASVLSPMIALFTPVSPEERTVHRSPKILYGF